MNYVAQARKPSPAALLGAIGVPAAFGALLVVGLAVTVVIEPKEPNLKGVTVTPKPVPPPPPKPDATQASTPERTTTTTYIPPEIPTRFNDAPPSQRPSSTPSNGDTFAPTGPINSNAGNGTEIGGGFAPTVPDILPTFDPVAASPANSPSRWVTNSDYRSSWVRREMQGSASFSLQVSASGRVTGCTITGSTGHTALDTATCRLITKRARFEPARDSNGAKVAGTYRNTVTWRLPE